MSEAERVVAKHIRALVSLVRVGLSDVPQSQRVDASDALAELEARLLARQTERADAWDDGYEAGVKDGKNAHSDGWVRSSAENPYRP